MKRKTSLIPAPPDTLTTSFEEIVTLIQQARQRAFQAVNTELIDLYWRVGEYISHKLASAAWGEGVVEQLARYLARKHLDLKGFTRASLFRMRQFYETYQGDKKVAPLVRQLSWSHNLMILGRCKYPEEREFYLRLATREKWSKRELERQLKGALFERAVLNPPKASAALKQLHPEIETIFKDSYLFDFLALPERHSEDDLQRGLVAMLISIPLGQYILEHKLGMIYAAETGFIVARNPDTVRAPDASFVRQEVIDRYGDYWPTAPDLAIEVISPNDVYLEVEEKVFEWLEAGTRMVITINPRRKIVTVYRSLLDVKILTENDVLDGADVIPGWQMPVKKLFST